VDTSVAVALLAQTHPHHSEVTRLCSGREVAVSGHALAETCSVLTRLPGDMRIAPSQAARLLEREFAEPLLLGPDVAGRLPEVLSQLGIAGGAVYDALVGLAAVEHGADLATRDARAKATYEAVGARVVLSSDRRSNCRLF